MPNPPAANPRVAERASWWSTKRGVGQWSIRDAYNRFLSFPMHLRHPRQTPVLTRMEGSVSYQGVSKGGGRHSPGELLRCCPDHGDPSMEVVVVLAACGPPPPEPPMLLHKVPGVSRSWDPLGDRKST